MFHKCGDFFQPVNDIWGVFWKGFHASNCRVPETKNKKNNLEINWYGKFLRKIFSALGVFLLPETRRTKGGDRSPVFIPPPSLAQHHLNKLGPVQISENPAVVAVRPGLNLVYVRGEEAIQRVTETISIRRCLKNKIAKMTHKTQYQYYHRTKKKPKNDHRTTQYHDYH